MIIGIDLGTTNSLVSIYRDEKSVLIPNALGDFLTPSVVGLDDDGTVIIGKAARERLITHPLLTVANFKRLMGSDRTITLGNRKFRPEDLSSLVLRSLKEDAEAFLGQEVREAVITVPAYFNDAQRKATRNAGSLAGLHVERLLNEPTAAALAYGLHQTEEESHFLVLDLGGGTFDVSVLEYFEDVMEVHASAGDNFLGGEDFVQILVREFLNTHQEAFGENESELSPALENQLRRRAEAVKRKLSIQNEATLSISHQDQELSLTLDAKKFERLSDPLLQRLRRPLEQAMRDARIRATDLDELVLVGGATRMPMIRNLVSRLFGRFPRHGLDPDHAIALGAAAQGGLKSREAALKEVVLTDVCPYTLGIEAGQEVAPGHWQQVFTPILERNTVIPASRVETFFTANEQQEQIQVGIFQGESRQIENNIRLGAISVKIPPRPKGQESIDVRFTYDINGLLEVEVKVNSTGKVEKLFIAENPGAMTKEQIQQRMAQLADLKIHPREKIPNRTLLARADRWYGQTLGDVRAHVGHHIDLFRAALDSQDEKAITKAANQLSEFLDGLENESAF